MSTNDIIEDEDVVTDDVDGAPVRVFTAGFVIRGGTAIAIAVDHDVIGEQDDRSGYACRGCDEIHPKTEDVWDESIIVLSPAAAATVAHKLLELAGGTTTTEKEVSP